MISAIDSLLRGPGLGPVILGSLCWVPWQDTLLSWYLTPPTCRNDGIPSKGEQKYSRLLHVTETIQGCALT